MLVERAELEENTATSAHRASKQGMGIWSGTQKPGTFPCSKEPSTCREVKTRHESCGVHGSSSSSPYIQNEPGELNQALGNLFPGCHTTKCPLCLPNSLGVTHTWRGNTESGGAALHRKTELGSVPAALSHHSLRSLFKFTEELCSKCH